ncbi:SirB2 family protein [Catenovulum sp. SM1970]|uniref:SirB2 family protein n=1 Tax=Marinifaba aquimaris TaxID=2741323 RepID=UPI0015725C14|nr:SirB2 family protein [Marinifaba aquimaris]NTS75993.1 SirB2 family protein [Marinifaba aquimaris]
MPYIAIKHTHLTLVLISVILFSLRFFWLMRQSPTLQAKWVKILPHAIDTLLLLSAVGLMMTIQQYPFQVPWLTEKLIAVILYIVCGVATFKWAKNNKARIVAFILSWSWVVVAAKIAVTKQALIF